MRSRGEGGWFATAYKYLMTTGEWIIKPIFNLFPPRVARHKRDIVYAPEPSNRKQRLDVEVPLGDGPFPVVVYVHGGGFISMDKTHYTRIAKSMAAGGYVVFNVNYRRGPRFRFPINVTDVGTAVAWVLEHASEYGGDASRMFMAGDSAGAHLVSSYATAIDEPGQAKAFRITELARPKKLLGLVLFYGAFDTETILKTDFPFVQLMLKSFLSRDEALFAERSRYASPLRHVTGRFPPCFITYAEKDKLAPESQAFARALEAKGVETEVLAFPPSQCTLIPHGYMNLWWRPCAREGMARAIDFMDRRKGM